MGMLQDNLNMFDPEFSNDLQFLRPSKITVKEEECSSAPTEKRDSMHLLPMNLSMNSPNYLLALTGICKIRMKFKPFDYPPNFSEVLSSSMRIFKKTGIYGQHKIRYGLTAKDIFVFSEYNPVWKNTLKEKIPDRAWRPDLNAWMVPISSAPYLVQLIQAVGHPVPQKLMAQAQANMSKVVKEPLRCTIELNLYPEKVVLRTKYYYMNFARIIKTLPEDKWEYDARDTWTIQKTALPQLLHLLQSDKNLHQRLALPPTLQPLVDMYLNSQVQIFESEDEKEDDRWEPATLDFSQHAILKHEDAVFGVGPLPSCSLDDMTTRESFGSQNTIKNCSCSDIPLDIFIHRA